MSKEALAKVVQRAISDASFRRQLSSDTAGALRGFDLTADEVSALRAGDAGRLSTLGVDQRMSKSFALGGGALAATKMAQSDLGTSNPSMIDDVSGVGSRTVIPSDPDATLTADDAGGGAASAGPRAIRDDPDGLLASKAKGDVSGSGRIGDDWKFADRAPQGSVAPVEGSPEATAAEFGRAASGAGYDAAARLARLDETFNGSSPTVDASAAGSDAARLARLDETFNRASPAVDASGESAPTTAFIDDSEGYLTSVGYDQSAATSAVTDAHDRGGENIVTRIADEGDASGGTAASEDGPNISS